MISKQEIRTRAKVQLRLTHTNTEDADIDLWINEAVEYMNNIIRLNPAKCCLTVINGECQEPEGYNSLICAEFNNSNLVYVNKNYFEQYDVSCSTPSLIDTTGVVKAISGKLLFPYETNGEAIIIYNKYNKVNGQWAIPDECSNACMWYACSMYALATNDQRYQFYDSKFNYWLSKANTRTQQKEWEQARGEVQQVLNEMFYTSEYFEVRR